MNEGARSPTPLGLGADESAIGTETFRDKKRSDVFSAMAARLRSPSTTDE